MRPTVNESGEIAIIAKIAKIAEIETRECPRTIFNCQSWQSWQYWQLRDIARITKDSLLGDERMPMNGRLPFDSATRSVYFLKFARPRLSPEVKH
jgi:hypothetical protein